MGVVMVRTAVLKGDFSAREHEDTHPFQKRIKGLAEPAIREWLDEKFGLVPKVVDVRSYQMDWEGKNYYPAFNVRLSFTNRKDDKRAAMLFQEAGLITGRKAVRSVSLGEVPDC